MQIRLIRHGKTPQGERRQYQGSLDTSLSENGRKSLRKADDRPEKVFVTPLKRTQETAEILFPGTKQIVVAGLAEMCFGDFEGRSWNHGDQHQPDAEGTSGTLHGTHRFPAERSEELHLY